MANLRGWVLYGTIGAGVAAYNVFTAAERDDSGAIVSGGNVDAFEIAVGDCFNDTNSSPTGAEEEISSLPAVPCAESHDNEVYAVFDLDAPDFPEGDALFDMAFQGCLDRFPAFVGRDYETSVLDIFAMYPTRESWNQLGDREVVCAVYDINFNKLTGSVRGLGI